MNEDRTDDKFREMAQTAVIERYAEIAASTNAARLETTWSKQAILDALTAMLGSIENEDDLIAFFGRKRRDSADKLAELGRMALKMRDDEDGEAQSSQMMKHARIYRLCGEIIDKFAGAAAMDASKMPQDGIEYHSTVSIKELVWMYKNPMRDTDIPINTKIAFFAQLPDQEDGDEEGECLMINQEEYLLLPVLMAMDQGDMVNIAWQDMVGRKIVIIYCALSLEDTLSKIETGDEAGSFGKAKADDLVREISDDRGLLNLHCQLGFYKDSQSCEIPQTSAWLIGAISRMSHEARLLMRVSPNRDILSIF